MRNGGGGGDCRYGVGWPRQVGEAEKARSKVEIGIHVGLIFDKTAAREMGRKRQEEMTERFIAFENPWLATLFDQLYGLCRKKNYVYRFIN